VKTQFLAEELEAIKKQGLYAHYATISSPNEAWFVVDGKRVLNLCSNNYLGFSNEPVLKRAAKEAIDNFGVGPGATPIVAGTKEIHIQLERRLADFKRTEASVLFQAGLTANVGTIPAVTGEGDVIFSDELNHASIVDGCRLSRAQVMRYAHNDTKDLKAKLEQGVDSRRKLIVTDGVFSMEGDIAPLPEIVELARRYEALVMVDDAHGEGVLGEHGRGIVDHYGLVGEVDIEMGTLSKAFGVMGGYIAGSQLLCDFLKQRARSLVFSTGITPPDIAACLAAVEILQESDERLSRLWENTNYFKEEIRSLGFDTGNSVTPITPVIVGDAAIASQLRSYLFEEGIFAQSFGYPIVPQGKARVRVMISAVHSRADLDFALEKFSEVGRQLGLIK
jgi:glycine C-acetyltransferase